MEVQFKPFCATFESTRSHTQADYIQDVVAALSLPAGYRSPEDFARNFSLGEATTEKQHPKTMKLSQTFNQSVERGVEMLLSVEDEIAESLESFIPQIEQQIPDFVERLKNGGRVFLVGCGSSGRAGIAIAKKLGESIPDAKERIIGVIAGGDSAMVKAREGSEDSFDEGKNVLLSLEPNENDTIILISASGSASFNAGVAQAFEKKNGPKIFYLYNSSWIPERTSDTIYREDNPVTPLLIDLMQTIAGSTRTTGATIAEASIGALITTAFYKIMGHPQADTYAKNLADNIKTSVDKIRESIPDIAKIVLSGKEIFLNPRSNFYRLRDAVDGQGFITYLAYDLINALRDATEVPPTFNSPSPEKESTEEKDVIKKPEFRAFCLGHADNLAAWKSMLGREIKKEDQPFISEYLLGTQCEGRHTYAKRPKGPGNLVVGNVNVGDDGIIPEDMLQELENVKEQGGAIGLIGICKKNLNEEVRARLVRMGCMSVVIENIPPDEMGLTESIATKMVFNAISNGIMSLCGKLEGNIMVDLRAANQKLLDRTMRITKLIAENLGISIHLSSEQLYIYVANIIELQRQYEAREQHLTSSIVRLVLTMLIHECPMTLEGMEQAVRLLTEHRDLKEIVQASIK